MGDEGVEVGGELGAGVEEKVENMAGEYNVESEGEEGPEMGGRRPRVGC
jgi:hypothetical protein